MDLFDKDPLNKGTGIANDTLNLGRDLRRFGASMGSLTYELVGHSIPKLWALMWSCSYPFHIHGKVFNNLYGKLCLIKQIHKHEVRYSY